MQENSVVMKHLSFHLHNPSIFSEEGSSRVLIAYRAICYTQTKIRISTTPSFFFEIFSIFCSQFTDSPWYNLPIGRKDGATSPRNHLFDRSSHSWQVPFQHTSTYKPWGRKRFRGRSREVWSKSSENKTKQLRKVFQSSRKAKPA